MLNRGKHLLRGQPISGKYLLRKRRLYYVYCADGRLFYNSLHHALRSAIALDGRLECNGVVLGWYPAG